MDCHCPVCGADLRRRKLIQAVVTRMETDCSSCKSTIRLNVHRAELIAVLLNFGAIVGLGAAAYWYRSQDLVLLALGAAMVGAAALPLLENTYLRTWPRFAKSDPKRDR